MNSININDKYDNKSQYFIMIYYNNAKSVNSKLLENCTLWRIELTLTAFDLNTFEVWPWLSIPGELRYWVMTHTHAKVTQFKSSRVTSHANAVGNKWITMLIQDLVPHLFYIPCHDVTYSIKQSLQASKNQSFHWRMTKHSSKSKQNSVNRTWYVYRQIYDSTLIHICRFTHIIEM